MGSLEMGRRNCLVDRPRGSNDLPRWISFEVSIEVPDPLDRRLDPQNGWAMVIGAYPPQSCAAFGMAIWWMVAGGGTGRNQPETVGSHVMIVDSFNMNAVVPSPVWTEADFCR